MATGPTYGGSIHLVARKSQRNCRAIEDLDALDAAKTKCDQEAIANNSKSLEAIMGRMIKQNLDEHPATTEATTQETFLQLPTWCSHFAKAIVGTFSPLVSHTIRGQASHVTNRSPRS